MAQRRQTAKAALPIALADVADPEPADGRLLGTTDPGSDASAEGSPTIAVLSEDAAAPARRSGRGRYGAGQARTSRGVAPPARRMWSGLSLGVLTEVPVDARIVSACGSAAPHLGGPRLARLGVCSSVRGEGRTSIAAGMAVVQGRDYGRATLLVDLDFDRPGLGSLFGVPNAPGIADVLKGGAPLVSAMHAVGSRVVVMPAGNVGGEAPLLAATLLESALLRELQDGFDVVIADLPALLGSSSGALLASLFDPLLLVIEANVTPMATVRQALSSLESPSDPVVMLNGVRSRLPGWVRRMVAI